MRFDCKVYDMEGNELSHTNTIEVDGWQETWAKRTQCECTFRFHCDELWAKRDLLVERMKTDETLCLYFQSRCWFDDWELVLREKPRPLQEYETDLISITFWRNLLNYEFRFDNMPISNDSLRRKFEATYWRYPE